MDTSVAACVTLVYKLHDQLEDLGELAHVLHRPAKAPVLAVIAVDRNPPQLLNELVEDVGGVHRGRGVRNGHTQTATARRTAGERKFTRIRTGGLGDQRLPAAQPAQDIVALSVYQEALLQDHLFAWQEPPAHACTDSRRLWTPADAQPPSR